MGLKVTTLARLPEETGRAFFVYFLDYGWDDELTRAMYANFDALASVASENRGLLIAGLNRTEFANEVLSWHRVNSDSADELLPAIMVTDVEPRTLAGSSEFDFGSIRNHPRSRAAWPARFLLIPLREVCMTTADVTALLQVLAVDPRSGRSLSGFEIQRVKAKGANAAADMVVLQPNIAGIGVDLNEVFRWSREKWESLSSKCLIQKSPCRAANRDFCASGARVPECTLRSGSRNRYFRLGLALFDSDTKGHRS